MKTFLEPIGLLKISLDQEETSYYIYSDLTEKSVGLSGDTMSKPEIVFILSNGYNLKLPSLRCP